MNAWDNDAIQFPRLLAEIMGVGLSHEQYAALSETMDLTPAEINELFDRADHAWQRIKARRYPRSRRRRQSLTFRQRRRTRGPDHSPA